MHAITSNSFHRIEERYEHEEEDGQLADLKIPEEQESGISAISSMYSVVVVK